MAGHKYKKIQPGKKKYGPAQRGPSAADREAVRAEQNEMNEIMRTVFGEDNPSQLNPDGIAGPATNAIRDVLGKLGTQLPIAADLAKLDQAGQMRAMNAYLKTPEGQAALKVQQAKSKEQPAKDMPALTGRMRDFVDGLPRDQMPNGFVQGSGVRAQPAVQQQPDPASKEGPTVEPPKPERVRGDSLLDQPIGVPLGEKEDTGSLLARPIDVARQPDPTIPSQGEPATDPDVVISRGRQQPGPTSP